MNYNIDRYTGQSKNKFVWGIKMVACTFFGHRQCGGVSKEKIRAEIVDLIENHSVDTFYVGNQGEYDSLVHSVLRTVVKEYPVCYAVVLAYMPPEHCREIYSDTIFPEGIETVPKRFAITWRNKWMIERSKYVIAYTTHSWGGAAKFVEYAIKHGRIVRNLGSD